MDTNGVGDVLLYGVLHNSDGLILQCFDFLSFGFPLFLRQGCVCRQAFVDGGHLCIQPVELAAYSLISVVVGSTGSRVVVARQAHVDFTVFQEEVHHQRFLVLGCVGDVAVGCGILYPLEGKCSVADDSRVEADEFAAFHFLQIYGVAVGGSFYGTGYGVTRISAASCQYSGCSEQITKSFHCFYGFYN